MKSFGEMIREKREANNLLLRELAAKMDIDPSMLSRIETGSKHPTREQVVQLASILNEEENKMLIQYLGERVVSQLKDEEELAIEAIMIAEQRIRYVRKSKPIN